MGFLTKLLLYLFISTTTLVFSYELVQYARDSMRISNMNTFYRVMGALEKNRIPKVKILAEPPLPLPP